MHRLQSAPLPTGHRFNHSLTAKIETRAALSVLDHEAA